MNKNLKQKGSILPFILLLIAVVVIAAAVYLYKNNEAEAPIVNDGTKLEILGNKDDLVSFSVNAGDTISGILEISGVVKNAYFFEANILVKLLDENQNVLKEGYGNATTDWMTVEPVSFTAIIDSTGLFGKGYILIQNDDPSDGEGGPAKKILIPVVFENKIIAEDKETMTVKVYFGDTIDAQSCDILSYVERIIPETTAVARAAIEELLKGPSESELKIFWTGLNSGITIKTLTIDNGVAYVDFSLSSLTATFNAPNKGSCGALMVTRQIEKTLMQFPTVKSVVIKVNGKPAENFIDP